MIFNESFAFTLRVIAALSICQLSRAQTVALPDPFFEGTYGFTIDGVGTYTEVNGPASFSGTQGSSVDEQSGSVLFNLAATPTPGIALSALTTGGAAGAEGQISYQFSIVGPAGLVPTTVTFTGGVNLVTDAAVPTASVTSFVALGSLAGNPQFLSDVYSISQSALSPLTATHSLNGVGSTLSGPSFSESDTFNLMANTTYGIYMSASVGATGDTTATAYVDPLIAIDPSFAGKYSIELSPGIGNAVSSVPELRVSVLFGPGAMLILAIAGYRRMSRSSKRLATC
jgi:hypothetical protein